jgi:hypothetical protein
VGSTQRWRSALRKPLMNIALASSLTYVTFFDPFLPSLQELIHLPDEHFSLIKHSFDLIDFEFAIG